MDNYKRAENAEEVQEYIRHADVVSFDFETAPDEKYRDDNMAAIDVHKSHITGVSFSTKPGEGIYAPIKHRDTKYNIDMTKILKEFSESDAVKIAHNLAFEAMFLYGENIVIKPPVYDTLLAAMMTLKTRTEFRTLSDCSLKTLVPQLLHVDLPTFSDVTAGRHFDELNPDDYETIRYACADSDYALQLYNLINSWFDRYLPKHRWIIENIESPTAIFVGIMKYNGVSVDKALMYQKQFDAGEKIIEIQREIKKFMGKDIDIGANASTDALKSYLYDDLKLPVLKTTAKYQAAADEESLILLKDWCKENNPDLIPFLNLIQEYRKWNKIKSTYIDGFLDAVNRETDKIHTSFFQLGTDTGRFASRTPNLQNMPRKDNDPVGIRNFLVASEGHIFIDFDFSQIELRVGSWYCRDKKMLETYRNDGDIHAQTTSVIYNITFDEATDKNAPHYKEQRSIAKNCNFGVFYGLFPNGLMRNLKKAGIGKSSVEMAKSVIKDVFCDFVFDGVDVDEILKTYVYLYTFSKVYMNAVMKTFDEEEYASYKYIVPVIDIEYFVKEIAFLLDVPETKANKMLSMYIYNPKQKQCEIFTNPLLMVNKTQILLCETLISTCNLERLVEKLIQKYDVDYSATGKAFEEKIISELKECEGISVNTKKIEFVAYDDKSVEFDLLATLEDCLLLIELKSLTTPYGNKELNSKEKVIEEGVQQVKRRVEIIKSDWEKIRSKANIYLPEKPYAESKIIKIVCTDIYDFTTLKYEGVTVIDSISLIKYFSKIGTFKAQLVHGFPKKIENIPIQKSGKPTAKEFREYLNNPITVQYIPNCLKNVFKCIPFFENDITMGIFEPSLVDDPYEKQIQNKNIQAVSRKVGRNDRCPCGSGKKYKNCCGK